MGKTIAEKILSAHSETEVSAGDFTIAEVDVAYFQDTTGPLAVRQFREMGFKDYFRVPHFDFLLHDRNRQRLNQPGNHIFTLIFKGKITPQLQNISGPSGVMGKEHTGAGLL